jgi:hypothetical protein
MSDILVRDLSPELEASLREYAKPRGLNLSQAAAELVQLGLEAEAASETPAEGVRASDYVTETLKEVLHTKDEAEEFIRSHQNIAGKTRLV